jgi:hypothetical protein
MSALIFAINGVNLYLNELDMNLVHRIISTLITIPLSVFPPSSSSIGEINKSSKVGEGKPSLMIQDCNRVASLFGDTLDGMKARRVDPDEDRIVLQCHWRDAGNFVPLHSRDVFLTVYRARAPSKNVTRQTSVSSGMRRVSAPTVEHAGGSVLANSTATPADIRSQFHIQFHDVHINIVSTYGRKVTARGLSDGKIVKIGNALLGLSDQ